MRIPVSFLFVKLLQPFVPHCITWFCLSLVASIFPKGTLPVFRLQGARILHLDALEKEVAWNPACISPIWATWTGAA
jgi:hypothetical protein